MRSMAALCVAVTVAVAVVGERGRWLYRLRLRRVGVEVGRLGRMKRRGERARQGVLAAGCVCRCRVLQWWWELVVAVMRLLWLLRMRVLYMGRGHDGSHTERTGERRLESDVIRETAVRRDGEWADQPATSS